MELEVPTSLEEKMTACQSETPVKGPRASSGQGMGHPEGHPDHENPRENAVGIARNGNGNEFRFGARGHDPDNERQPFADLLNQQNGTTVGSNDAQVDRIMSILALRGILKRTWEYIPLLEAFPAGVEDMGLGPYLRSLSPRPEMIPDNVIGDLLDIQTNFPEGTNLRVVGWDELKVAIGCVTESPQCVILEMLKRTHHAMHNMVHHCK
jgi:hypothetical protein